MFAAIDLMAAGLSSKRQDEDVYIAEISILTCSRPTFTIEVEPLSTLETAEASISWGLRSFKFGSSARACLPEARAIRIDFAM